MFWRETTQEAAPSRAASAWCPAATACANCDSGAPPPRQSRSEKIDVWATKFLAWGGRGPIFRLAPGTEQSGETAFRPLLFSLAASEAKGGRSTHWVSTLLGG